MIGLLLLAPVGHAGASGASAASALAEAEALLRKERFVDALELLRPLAERDRRHPKVLFLIGLASIEAARGPDATEDEREALLDEAVAAFRSILVDRPDLVRARLELARAFFLQGEDDLARRHFEHVLGGTLPDPVASNVRGFLAQIRKRRRWSAYLGASVASDTNIGAASDEEIVYIFDLPFRRNAPDELTTSGVGVSLWAGGEYQQPLGEKWRMRTGADLARREYAGSGFDETILSVHAGPRWLLDGRTDLSVLANGRWRSLAGEVVRNHTGVRIEARRRLAPRLTASAEASWHRRNDRRDDRQDGPVIGMSAKGTWIIGSTMQASATVGYGKERPVLERYRNDSRRVRVDLSVALPGGFNVGGSGGFRWSRYRGSWHPFTRDGAARRDRTRTLSLSVYRRDFTLFGFSPQLVVTREARTSTAQLHDYERTRGDVRFVRQF